MAGLHKVVFGQGVTLRKGVNNIVAREPQGSAAYLGKRDKATWVLATLGTGEGQVDVVQLLICIIFRIIYLLPVLILSIILCWRIPANCILQIRDYKLSPFQD